MTQLKKYLTIGILLLAFMGCPFLTTKLSAQDNLQVKDKNGSVLLEARESGVLVRKMTSANRIAIAGLSAADNGLMVYDTDSKSLWLWQDTAWVQLDGVDRVDDADHDPMNEANVALVLNDSILNLTDSAGTLSVNLSSLINDADHDALNEVNISMLLNDSLLEISDAGGMLSVNLAPLLDDGKWEMDSNKVYNATAHVGVGTNEPQARLHVSDSVGVGEHIMLIENRDHEGNGLMIKINGSHPLFIKGQNGAPDFFITHPGKGALAAFDTIATDIRNYLLNNSLNLGSIGFSDIGTSNGIFAQLGIGDLMIGGLCKGGENLVQQYNSLAPSSITLPSLPLQSLPADIYDVPPIPSFPTVPNFTINLPSYQVCGIFGNCYPFDLPPYTVSTSFINSRISTFNSTLGPVNLGIATANTTVETGYDGLVGALSLLDGLVVPLPQLPIPQNIGPISCPAINPWDSIDINLQPLNPFNYNRVNPLSNQNAFITFADKYENKLGAITAQGLDEFALDYFTKEVVLNIGGKIAGVIAPNGNLVGNSMELIEEALKLYKATDKMGVSYSSGHGDYAEWLEREDHTEELGYGDIVGIRGGKISLSLEGAEQVMVVSKAPIVLGNTPEPGKENEGNNIAFIGQVPVKVMGSVNTGDFIVANPETPGYGLAVPENELTADQLALAVGRSWETNQNAGFKYVNTIVGMHNNAWAGPVKSLKQKVDQNETAIQLLTQRLDHLEAAERNASSLITKR